MTRRQMGKTLLSNQWVYWWIIITTEFWWVPGPTAPLFCQWTKKRVNERFSLVRTQGAAISSFSVPEVSGLTESQNEHWWGIAIGALSRSILIRESEPLLPILLTTRDFIRSEERRVGKERKWGVS